MSDIELREVRVGDCGCPEEEYLFDGIDLTIHFEPNGDVDAYIDAADWEDEVSIKGMTSFSGRHAVFSWARNLLEPVPTDRRGER